MTLRKTISREDIERKAFQIYMVRGRQHGHDVDDWLRAEKEVNESCGLHGSHGSNPRGRNIRRALAAVGSE
jgi:Protein of unknown function (DUF2934)